MAQTIEGLEKMVKFGVESGKKNMIVDLDVLSALFAQRDIGGRVITMERRFFAVNEFDCLLSLLGVPDELHSSLNEVSFSISNVDYGQANS
jgi:hypothetical protein